MSYVTKDCVNAWCWVMWCFRCDSCSRKIFIYSFSLVDISCVDETAAYSFRADDRSCQVLPARGTSNLTWMKSQRKYKSFFQLLEHFFCELGIINSNWENRCYLEARLMLSSTNFPSSCEFVRNGPQYARQPWRHYQPPLAAPDAIESRLILESWRNLIQ